MSPTLHGFFDSDFFSQPFDPGFQYTATTSTAGTTAVTRFSTLVVGDKALIDRYSHLLSGDKSVISRQTNIAYLYSITPATTTRVKFNSIASTIGAYTVVLNPSYFQLNYNKTYRQYIENFSSRSFSNSYFDNRDIVMRWTHIRQDYTDFSDMISTVKGYRDSVKYIHFNNADYRVTGTGWAQYLVTDVRVNIHSGPLIFYDLEIVLHKED